MYNHFGNEGNQRARHDLAQTREEQKLCSHRNSLRNDADGDQPQDQGQHLKGKGNAEEEDKLLRSLETDRTRA